ncbi:hypothetical protein GQ55_5G401400 [Panicum hallii var. hallii]|uniref:Uncharacterized protein n=1 Tax=Panicum hallii var. hallii TaxID=1504633 RepID=A0A2T7DNH6_9POAL|nr:hypothetical protein GQ55_5G401400 [Panicum hallii var. hallii]
MPTARSAPPSSAALTGPPRSAPPPPSRRRGASRSPRCSATPSAAATPGREPRADRAGGVYLHARRQQNPSAPERAETSTSTTTPSRRLPRHPLAIRVARARTAGGVSATMSRTVPGH